MKTQDKKHKTFFKRVGALIMAMCIMSLTFVTFALADNEGSTTTEPAPTATAVPSSTSAQTINFTGIANGDTIRAYRLVSYTSTYNGYVFNGTFGNYINAKKDAETDETIKKKTTTDYFASFTNAQVGALVSEYAAKAEEVNGEYKPIANDLTEDVSATAGEDEKVSLDLEPGYYMILGETTADNSVIYSPTCVFVKPEGSTVKVYAGAGSDITTTRTIAMKTENAPTIDKMTRNNTHENETTHAKEAWTDSITSQVGDTIDFRLQIDIPAYSDGTELNLTVKDTMTNLTFNPGTVKVYSDADLTTEIAGAVATDDEKEKITVSDYDETTHTQDLSIELDFKKVHPTSNETSRIYVFYQTTAHSDSSVNNADAENVAWLQYSNVVTPDLSYDTDKQKTFVDLYELKLYKTDEDGNALSGAKFEVYEGGASSTNKMTFTKRGDNEYYPDEKGTITEVECDADGYLHIVGLDLGTYKFIETVAPTGYYKPSEGFLLTLVYGGAKNTLSDTSSFTAINTDDSALITTDKTKVITEKDEKTTATAAPAETPDVDVSGPKVDIDDPTATATPAATAAPTANKSVYQVYLKNSTTPVLPTAGGIGTVVFTIVGIAMMATACVIIYARRRNMNVK
jgi:LPXTG-motif cell wall-anchored protein